MHVEGLRVTSRQYVYSDVLQACTHMDYIFNTALWTDESMLQQL